MVVTPLRPMSSYLSRYPGVKIESNRNLKSVVYYMISLCRYLRDLREVGNAVIRIGAGVRGFMPNDRYQHEASRRSGSHLGMHKYPGTLTSCRGSVHSPLDWL